MNRPILNCGCAANSTDGNGVPSCASHAGIADTSIAEVQPFLEGRTAICGCKRTAPSNTDLPFFQYRGPGSEAGTNSCKHCGYFECAHDPAYMAKNVASNRKTVVEQGKCKGFESRGSFEYDSYYCGCRGWE